MNGELSQALRGRNEVATSSLAALTTMRVGGPVTLVLLEDARDLPELRERGARWLGKGANIVAGDDPIEEPVVRLGRSFAQLRMQRQDDDRVRVCAGAAVDLAKLVGRCCDAGLIGPAGLAGVPASVGGALCMNAGTAQCWIGDFIDRVQVLLPSESAPRWLGRDEIRPVYRSGGLPTGTLYLGCELLLTRGDAQEQRQRARELKRAKAASQPLQERSAGCIFKNPDPDLPAGRLLDECGCKDWTVGEAQVSTRHANFIVNRGRASGADVFALIRRLRAHVWGQRRIDLQVEARTWQAPADLHASAAEVG